jgi:hypothetical protein
MSAFAGFAAADGDLVTPLWSHNLTSENDTAKFSSDGTIVTNGQCLWLASTGKLLGTYPASGGVSISAEYQNYFRGFCPLFSGDKVAYHQLYDNYAYEHIHAVRYRSLDGTDTIAYGYDAHQNACDLAVAPNSDTSLAVAFPTWLDKQTLWRFYKNDAPHRVDNYGACHIRYLVSKSNCTAGRAGYSNAVSPYPFDFTPNELYGLQSSATGIDCYATSDGHLVWHIDVSNLGSLNVSCLSDNTTFAYTTKDAVTGELTAHFADVATGDDKGTCVVPAPVVAASPADNTLLVQWSWGGLFDPGSAITARPARRPSIPSIPTRTPAPCLETWPKLSLPGSRCAPATWLCRPEPSPWSSRPSRTRTRFRCGAHRMGTS